MKKIFLLAPMATLALAIMLALAACAPETPDGPTGPVAPADAIELTTRGAEKIAADNDFAFRFFRETIATAKGDEKQNAFVSPLSMTMALGMLYNGTSPEAATEMATALGLADLTADEINAHYKALGEALLAADPKTALAIANSIWSRDGYPVKPTFYDLNRTWYGAEVQSRDFSLQATVDEINRWCADNTAGKIPEILKEPIPAEVVMYLINAVYFKGEWKFAFDKSDTRDEPFTLADGSTTQVSMMNQTTDLPVYYDDKFQCVELPYGNGAFGMLAVLPTPESSLDELVASFDAATYNEISNGLHEMGVEVKLPRWKQECEFGLVDATLNLGMERIFVPGNLGGISDDPRLAVGEIRQKTFVEVNEQGTEAAAITIIGNYATAEPSGPPTFHADRPFLYLIRERSTGAILFIGRMDKPQV